VSVLAHGVGQSQDLPLPLDLVLQAGAATVVLSFLGAAFLWRRPRLGGGTVRRSGASRFLRLPVLLLCLYVVADALFGPRDESNPAAHAVFVWLWVGLVPLSVVLGPVWRPINPLRTLFALLRLPEQGLRPGIPPRAGHWPATVTLLGFAWWELVAPHRAEPRVVGVVLLAYGVVQLAVAAVLGVEWFARADCFEVYSDLAGRLSPLRWRKPLAGLIAVAPSAGLAAFVAVWWGSTIFDSASGSPWWAGFVQHNGSPRLLGTAGLILVCAVVFAGVRVLAGKVDVTASLVPIAVGYTLAHYLTLLIVEGPRGLLLLIQQWGLAAGAGWNVVLAPGVVSILQITLILTGHALGVVVAHDMALRAAPHRPALATLADELPVVLFMIACTWIGLFLLFVR
jgi:hypothetical protein